MRYNRLGSTGLVVSELCLGAMTFGTDRWRIAGVNGLDQAQCTALVRQGFDAGINFIDTADVYTCGQSERFVGGAIRELGLKRSDVIVATKAFGTMGPRPNDSGYSRHHLMNAVDESLERLGVDYIDLYQLHGWDPETPMEEALRALDDMVRSGRVRYIGVSNWAAWQIARSLGTSERLGLEKFASLQAYYSVAGRELERELVPLMQAEGIGLMVWSPLIGGLLSGKYGRSTDGSDGGQGRRVELDFPPVDRSRAFALIDAMGPMAESRGRTIAQIALSWLLHQEVVSTVIVGAKREDQLADNIASTEVELTWEDMAELDRLSALPPEYPGWIFDFQGGFRSKLLGPRRKSM